MGDGGGGRGAPGLTSTPSVPFLSHWLSHGSINKAFIEALSNEMQCIYMYRILCTY